MRPSRNVLVVVHTVTSVNRLADILTVFESDLRVQLVHAAPGSSAVSNGVIGLLEQSGAVTIPWDQAVATEFDLAIAVNHSGALHEIKAPLIVLSHGIGYSKYSPEPGARSPEPGARSPEPGTRNPEPGTRNRGVYGLSPEWLLHDGAVIPAAIVLSHDHQLDLLAGTTPAAAPVAVVGGDPCYDRIRASVPYRRRYRRALHVPDGGTRVVAVTSTWGGRSLFGSWPDLFRELLAELPVDGYRVLGILHPNTWYGHGPAQIRGWLADCVRAGLTLVPPQHGWQQALIAADLVIGDHGAVTSYAAAADRPTVLAAFPEGDVVPGTAAAALGRLAPRLDRVGPLRTQLDQALAEFRPGRYRAVADLVSSLPDRSAGQLRALFYRLLDLPELPTDPPVPPFPADAVTDAVTGVAGRAAEPRVHAVLAGGRVTTADSVRLTRLPADLMHVRPGGPDLTNAHLVVHDGHPLRSLHSNAAVIFCHAGELAEPPEQWADRIARTWPRCPLFAVVDGDQCTVYDRDERTVRVVAAQPAADQPDPLVFASMIYLLRAYGHRGALPQRLLLRMDDAGSPVPVDVLSHPAGR